MSKESCEAAESAEGATLRMARAERDIRSGEKPSLHGFFAVDYG